MPRNLSQIYVHAIWSVKNREAILHPSFRQDLFDHIRTRFSLTKLQIIEIGGVEDHIHILFQLPLTVPISEAIKLIKGESSFWINTKTFLAGTFKWQNGYGAFSVSPNRLEHILNYIQNQEKHHKGQNFEEELLFLQERASKPRI
jgi:REP element-mobilizing transposase RayT